MDRWSLTGYMQSWCAEPCCLWSIICAVQVFGSDFALIRLIGVAVALDAKQLLDGAAIWRNRKAVLLFSMAHGC
ncbi:hypothetical protein U1Q18_003899 [Sarracenia purpurea var. burkii]